MVARSLLITIAGILLSGCGLEAELLGPVMDQGHVVLPEPEDTFLHGQALGFAGGSVRIFTNGTSGPDGEAVVDDAGLFVQRLPGAFEATGALLWITSETDVGLALVPEVPRAASIFHEAQQLYVWEQHELLSNVDSLTTAAAMTIHAAASRLGLGLDALAPETIRRAYDRLLAHRDGEEHPFTRFERAITTLDSTESAQSVSKYRVDALNGSGSFLSEAWLASVEVDMDGDGVVDSDVSAFDSLLAEAGLTLELDTCFDSAATVVVFHVDLRPGRLNGNCAEVDPYKHTSPAPGKSVFLTGGIHEDTPVCRLGDTSDCLTEAQIDAANALLGDWEPNRVAMHDDGTQGDVQANDGVWTLVLTLPYIAPILGDAGDVDEAWAGVRLGYKYSFGQAGSGWTDSEEWPGNRRLLELIDLNGDHIVTRYDVFGDETSNKDFVNQRAPVKGGCSFVTWAQDTEQGCLSDTRENRLGRLGVSAACDGGADDIGLWDEPGPVTPLTIPCSES
ncbi:MAG: choice-of-anchor X domain-containing protein [Myxococcota bacterium]